MAHFNSFFLSPKPALKTREDDFTQAYTSDEKSQKANKNILIRRPKCAHEFFFFSIFKIPVEAKKLNALLCHSASMS